MPARADTRCRSGSHRGRIKKLSYCASYTLRPRLCRRRPPHRRREIAAELFDEIDRNAGMNSALTVEEPGLLVQRHDRPVPYVGVQIQAAAALAPDSHELFRSDIVSRRRQR